MGAIICAPPAFRANNSIPGQGSEVLRLKQLLGYSDKDINWLYAYFKELDMDNSGTVDIIEFVCVNRVDSNQGQAVFGEIVFRLFDDNHDGKLNFRELLLALWVFCAAEQEKIQLFTFQIFDTDNSDTLTSEEVKFMISLIWSMNIVKHVKDSFDLLDHNCDGTVSIPEFLIYIKAAPILLFPVFELQAIIRDKTLGSSRWSHITTETNKRREKQVIAEFIQPTDKRVSLHFLVDMYAHGPHSELFPESLMSKLAKGQQKRRASQAEIMHDKRVKQGKTNETTSIRKPSQQQLDNESSHHTHHKKVVPAFNDEHEKALAKIQAATRGKIARKKLAADNENRELEGNNKADSSKRKKVAVAALVVKYNPSTYNP